ncbi:MAG: DUF4132 domain-containing protein [Leptolyngbya sp. Prado105]|jgi:hypothetical protein|nr:DUF4132 domain-containing protein [Leptolyngbya sp. Prado105]
MLRDRNPLIDLDPADWCWATWRKRPQLERSKPQPFELDQAITQLKKAKRLKSGRWKWNDCEIPVSMSIEEARFWVHAIVRSYRYDRVRDLVRYFESTSLSSAIESSEIQDWFTSSASCDVPPQMAVALSHFLSVDQLIDQLSNSSHRHHSIFLGFKQLILPYLNETEFEKLRIHIQETWEPQRFYMRIYLSSLLGLQNWNREFIETLTPERTYHSCDFKFRLGVLFGLESADLVVYHSRRLKLRLGTSEQVRAWLAHTELTALEFVAESIAAIKNNREAQNAVAMFEVLALVRSPIVAPHVLQLAQKSQVRHQAQAWLEDNPELSIAGLLPLTIAKHPLAETAIAWLRMMQRQGYRDFIREHMSPEYQQIELQIFDAPKREELDTMPDWFTAIVESAQKLEPLDWVKPSDLPAIVVGETQLSEAQHQAILNLLQADPENHSAMLKHYANPESLSQFAWQLYERWALKKPAFQSAWVILALGRLGDDAIALKLADLIRVWCKASWYELATAGIAALALIASDLAIFQLMQFAYQPISRLIQPNQALNAIADSRNLSRRQLEDCAMLQYLQKKFAPLSNWESRSRKNELKQFFMLQTLRFEYQMVHREAYTLEEFQALFNPLLFSMTQTLIWQAESTYFRITEDGTLADSSDSPVELASEVKITLAHPLELPDRLIWAELLADYELIPPFAQVNRPIYSVSREEQDATIVTRFVDRGVFTVNLTQSLMKLGWTETYIGRGRWRGYCKRFCADETVAILGMTEMPRTYSYQVIDRIFFLANDWDGRRIPTDDDRMLLKTVSPLVFSEVLREVDHLTHRSRYA